MLEQALVIKRSQGSRFLSLPVSIAIHVAIVGAAVAAAVWNVDLPSRPPNQVATYSIGRMPEPPGPPPARGGGEARPKPVVARPPEDVAPDAIPPEVPDLPVAEAGDAPVPGDDGGGDSAGVPWGEDGGIGTSGGGGSVVQGADQPAPILRPGGDVSVPLVLTRVDPRYPEAARAARLEGTVMIECVIGSDGRVRDPRVFRSAHPILDRAALDAVTHWRFKPATLNGNAVDVWFYLTVRFTLER